MSTIQELILLMPDLKFSDNLKFEAYHNNMAAATNCQKAYEMNVRRYGRDKNDLWQHSNALQS